ncbi:MrcB family domain-containing protein [Microcoleus vaginatus]|uniref:MrcB family domain-containing protein n=1 Tax=Microcoleus vaginatus TaxID=119532 RepID=UPI00403F8A49|nr:DUF3578 domain-containing protein [Microcoleus vaginatus HSN003]
MAIFNKLVTEIVQSGFYCVYFFRADFYGIYLSLNQGIADKLGSDQLREFYEPLALPLDSIPKATTLFSIKLSIQVGRDFQD